jgi:hypothetical protein
MPTSESKLLDNIEIIYEPKIVWKATPKIHNGFVNGGS